VANGLVARVVVFVDVALVAEVVEGLGTGSLGGEGLGPAY